MRCLVFSNLRRPKGHCPKKRRNARPASTTQRIVATGRRRFCEATDNGAANRRLLQPTLHCSLQNVCAANTRQRKGPRVSFLDGRHVFLSSHRAPAAFPWTPWWSCTMVTVRHLFVTRTVASKDDDVSKNRAGTSAWTFGQHSFLCAPPVSSTYLIPTRNGRLPLGEFRPRQSVLEREVFRRFASRNVALARLLPSGGA